MVRDCRQLLRGGLCRGNVHSPVDLHTIGGNDLSIHRFRDLDGQRCFAGGRGPRHYNQRIRFQPHGTPLLLRKMDQTILPNIFSSSRRVMTMATGRPCGQLRTVGSSHSSRSSSCCSRSIEGIFPLMAALHATE